MTKFRGKGKFRGPRKTVGPNHEQVFGYPDAI